MTVTRWAISLDEILAREIKRSAAGEPISARGCMAHAVMTSADKITADARRRLRLLIEGYLG